MSVALLVDLGNSCRRVWQGPRFEAWLPTSGERGLIYLIHGPKKYRTKTTKILEKRESKLETACNVPWSDGAVGVPVAVMHSDTLDVVADGILEEVVFVPPPLVVFFGWPLKRYLHHVCSGHSHYFSIDCFLLKCVKMFCLMQKLKCIPSFIYTKLT